MGLIDRLITYAKRTPYFHLPGYMERYWLVPYRQRISREIDEGTAVSYDGTGPVSFRERPFVWCSQQLGIAIRLHHILRSDTGRHPHDHPWSFVTVILRGGYYEMLFDEHGVCTSTTWHGPGSILFRRANTWHRLIVPLDEGKECWTLFITGPWKQTWGFLVDGKKIDYRDYESAQ